MYKADVSLEETKRDYPGTILLMYGVCALAAVVFTVLACMDAHPFGLILVTIGCVLAAPAAHLLLRRHVRLKEKAEAERQDRYRRETAGR